MFGLWSEELGGPVQRVFNPSDRVAWVAVDRSHWSHLFRSFALCLGRSHWWLNTFAALTT